MDTEFVESLIASSRKDRHMNDYEIRYMAINQLADKFLENVTEDGLETRAYLLTTTLPTVIYALEQLLKEMQKRNLSYESTKYLLVKKDALETDKPAEKFDCLNWLDLKAEKEAKRLAEIEARRLRREQEEKERLARIAETKAQYTDFLSLSFKLWINSLWRKSPGELFRHEIVEELTNVSKSVDIQADTQIYQKVLGLIEALTTPNTPFPEANKYNKYYDENEPLYSLDCATIERWDNEYYVKIFLRLMINWNINELTTFLRVLSSVLSGKGTEMATLFEEALYIPKFPKIVVVRDWLQQLQPIIQIMNIPNPLLRDAIKKACLGFCVGREDPRFTFVKTANMEDEIIENNNPAIAFAETAYVRFMKCLLGEFGLENYRQVMEHIKSEASKIAEIMDKLDQSFLGEPGSKSKDLQTPVEGEEATPAIGEALHFIIMGILKKVPEKNGFLELPYLLQIINIGLQSFDSASDEGRLLTVFKSHLASKDKVKLEQVVQILEHSTDYNEKDAQTLANCLEALIKEKQQNDKLEEEQIQFSEAKRQTRDSAESEAIKSLHMLAKDINLNIANACSKVVDIYSLCFTKIYPESSVYSRLALKESSTKLIEGKEKLKENETVVGNSVIDTYLRVIATSPDLKDKLCGLKIPEGKGIDYQMFFTGNVIKMPRVGTDVNLNEDVFFTVEALTSAKSEMSFIGVPFTSSHDQRFGTLDFLLSGESFDAPDAMFLEKSGQIVSSLLEIVDARQKAIALALSAKEFIQARLECEVNVFLAESDAELYTLTEGNIVTATDNIQQEVFGSPLFAGITAQLLKLEEGHSLYDQILNTFGTGVKSISSESHSTLVPVFTPSNGKCVAVLQIATDSIDKQEDIARYSAALGKAMKEIANESFGYEFHKEDLDCEIIDEVSKRKVLFGKVMLLQAREGIAQLDSKSIAEMRSYRKPPQSVHRIIKGALYLFGHQPKDLKLWVDTVKHVNMSLLEMILEFDPTSVHKKIRIKRAKKILKLLSWSDTKQKGSLPAQLICDWLISSMALRDIALAARKARPDIFERARTAESAQSDVETDNEEMENENDEGGEAEPIDVDAEVLNEQGNEIKEIVIVGDTVPDEAPPEASE
ncbi:EF-hand calcium-binding domain-containing protein 5 [Boothiomyces macroporosus]|uniref:EF-hand calcium-binding domain-containing protein 5 n=1 Tax=Boothiomyces macroporosus TaxID=261099 RepID=A0AAD5ULP1_9FUNG|nr:EF-hand calcium-binding domain-containing protein 5 [Boothiomyces macroporosus]